MNVTLDPTAIAVAEATLKPLIELHFNCISFLSLPEAVTWLELQLPPIDDLQTTLTWATAMDQLSTKLQDQPLWGQVLQTESYNLRRRAQAFDQPRHTYG